ncbi:unnamed protein product [Ectocarpus sp. CCAP 1310/34]|nr:unnamed protein product [Ectocarpus sp. CCAP 1310/34]
MLRGQGPAVTAAGECTRIMYAGQTRYEVIHKWSPHERGIKLRTTLLDSKRKGRKAAENTGYCEASEVVLSNLAREKADAIMAGKRNAARKNGIPQGGGSGGCGADRVMSCPVIAAIQGSHEGLRTRSSATTNPAANNPEVKCVETRQLVAGACVSDADSLPPSTASPNRRSLHSAYDFGDPTYLGNCTLYWGTGIRSGLSFAHYVRKDGWGGMDCGRCLDVSVCPSRTVNGQKRRIHPVVETVDAVAATNCSANTLLLTEEEARSEARKICSCSCGGGDDGWTDFMCRQQPDTWIQWAVTVGGMEEDPAFVAVEEFGYIHARTAKEWPGQVKYHPRIFDGSTGP